MHSNGDFPGPRGEVETYVHFVIYHLLIVALTPVPLIESAEDFIILVQLKLRINFQAPDLLVSGIQCSTTLYVADAVLCACFDVKRIHPPQAY